MELGGQVTSTPHFGTFHPVPMPARMRQAWTQALLSHLVGQAWPGTGDQHPQSSCLSRIGACKVGADGHSCARDMVQPPPPHPRSCIAAKGGCIASGGHRGRQGETKERGLWRCRGTVVGKGAAAAPASHSSGPWRLPRQVIICLHAAPRCPPAPQAGGKPMPAAPQLVRGAL